MGFFKAEVIILVLNILTIIRSEQIDTTIIFGRSFLDEDTLILQDDMGQSAKLSLTFPGTRWCGPGNTANGYDDLGKYKETDKCCRDHDNCENIPAGEEKHGLRNDDIFTRLHCECDRKFYECLHKINKTISNVIGYQYFTFRNKCYKEEYPIIECLNYDTKIFTQRCTRYRFDRSKSRKYQWFDLPYYNSKTYPSNEDAKILDPFYQREHEELKILDYDGELD